MNDSFKTLYASYQKHQFFLDTSFIFRLQKCRTMRIINGSASISSLATSIHRGYQLSPSINFGYDTDVSSFENVKNFAGSHVTLEPHISFTYNHIRENGYTETGGGSVGPVSNNLTLLGHSTAFLRSEIGFTLNKTMILEESQVLPYIQLNFIRAQLVKGRILKGQVTTLVSTAS